MSLELKDTEPEAFLFSFNLLQINDELSSLVVAQLLFLQSESSKKAIHMYINSPGKGRGCVPNLFCARQNKVTFCTVWVCTHPYF